MPFDRDKFKSLVHYVCSTAGDPAKLGAIKLNKICWLADFTSYYQRGRSITDATYVRRQFGLAPRSIIPALAELEREKALVISEKILPGYTQRMFYSLRPVDASVFDEEERALIDRMTRYVCDEHTEASISEMSHDHIWQVAADGEEIPYFTIFAIPGMITDSEREWAAQEIEGMRNN